MILGIIAAVITAAILLGAYYAYRVAFYSPEKKRTDTIDFPTGEGYDDKLDHMQNLVRQMRERPFEPVTITSFDGKTLYGRYYHVRDGAPLQVQMHGYRSHAFRDFCGGAKLAMKLGHNVLLADQRAHGKSQGSTISFGVLERFDCQRWAWYARQRFGADVPIILTGISMGAATVLMASDLDLPETVRGIVADCPYSSPREILVKVAADMGMPPKLAGVFCSLGSLLYGHFRLDSASAENAVKHTRLPVLLLHGENDTFVPCDMSRKIYNTCASEKQLETFPDASHGVSYLKDPKRYESAVQGFISRCIGQ